MKDNIPRAQSWRKNDWRNQHGEPRENVDLWKSLLSAHQKAGIPVHFEWTPGKKSPILKVIDKAAKSAAKRGGKDIDRDYTPGIISRSLVKGSASRFPANGQTAIIRPYRKNVMRGGENKVRFDLYSDESGRFAESCYAFATASLAATLHRQHGYRVRFNASPNYPQIVELVEEVEISNRI